MLEKVKFKNHIGESIDFGKNGIFLNYNDLHDYSWDYQSDNDKISYFKKAIVPKNLPIIIRCSNAQEGLQVKNELMEIAEKDILTNEAGRLIIGDYYMKCFIKGSKKSDYLINKGYMKANLEVVTDYPKWIKETTVVFKPYVESSVTENIKRNFDYNFDYPHDYTSEFKNKKLNNDGFYSSNFKIIIYGYVLNPIIRINNHVYEVKCEISDNEYLTIDSINKTILLTRYNGVIQNEFNKRNKDSYIFEPIPSGENLVLWNNEFNFDIILFDERSEPKWI